MITIYHNPRCSKSREALAMVEQFAASQQLELRIVEYLKASPTTDQLRVLHGQLGCGVRDMVRTNEEEYTALGLTNAGDAALLEAVAACPKLLQRPIVVYKGRAVIARPPERLSDFLK